MTAQPVFKKLAAVHSFETTMAYSEGSASRRKSNPGSIIRGKKRPSSGARFDCKLEMDRALWYPGPFAFGHRPPRADIRRGSRLSIIFAINSLRPVHKGTAIAS